MGQTTVEELKQLRKDIQLNNKVQKDFKKQRLDMIEKYNDLIAYEVKELRKLDLQIEQNNEDFIKAGEELHKLTGFSPVESQ